MSDKKKRKLYDQYGTADEQRIPYGWGSGAGGAGASGFGGFGSWADILDSIRRGEGVAGAGGFNVDDIFGGGGFGGSGFGGQYQPQPQKGRDMNVTLNVSFDEAFNGCVKKVSVRNPQGGVETLDVKMPAGAVDGGRVRFRGKGAAGANRGPGRRFACDYENQRASAVFAPWRRRAHDGAHYGFRSCARRENRDSRARRHEDPCKRSRRFSRRY